MYIYPDGFLNPPKSGFACPITKSLENRFYANGNVDAGYVCESPKLEKTFGNIKAKKKLLLEKKPEFPLMDQCFVCYIPLLAEHS